MSPENILITVISITAVVLIVALAILLSKLVQLRKLSKLDAIELIYPVVSVVAAISVLTSVAISSSYFYSINQLKGLSDKQEKIEKELTEYPFNEDEETANMRKRDLESELEKIKKDKSNVKTSMEKNNAREDLKEGCYGFKD